MDNLAYTYTTGNQLSAVADNAGASYKGELFVDGNTSGADYSYDANGNMKTDLNKGITTAIVYNYLNLPQTVSTPSATINYTYDATGQKLKKVVGINTTDYIAGIHYENNLVSFIQTAEGRVTKSGSVWTYEYNLKDHLGNVRVSFRKGATGTAELLQKDDYYPFGLTYSSPNAGENKYLYNGKELQLETDWYDYGARMYDAALGRFFNIDRFGEKYMDLTPYQYGANNPILYIDINGDSLSVTGSQSATQNFVDLANKGLGNKGSVSVDKNGNVSLEKGKGKASKQQKSFYKDLKKVIKDKGKTSLSLVENDKGVEIGSFQTGTIDVADMRNLGSSDLTAPEETSAQGALIHEIAEQYDKQVNGTTDINQAHKYGTAAENRTNGSIRNESMPTAVNDGSGNQVGSSLNSTVTIGNSSSTVNIIIINGNVNRVLINGKRKK